MTWCRRRRRERGRGTSEGEEVVQSRDVSGPGGETRLGCLIGARGLCPFVHGVRLCCMYKCNSTFVLPASALRVLCKNWYIYSAVPTYIAVPTYRAPLLPTTHLPSTPLYLPLHTTLHYTLLPTTHRKSSKINGPFPRARLPHSARPHTRLPDSRACPPAPPARAYRYVRGTETTQPLTRKHSAGEHGKNGRGGGGRLH